MSKVFIFCCCIFAVLGHAFMGYAGLEGDPFGEQSTLFESAPATQKEEQNFFIGGFVESRNQANVTHMHRPLSLRQTLHVEALWELAPFTFFGSAEGIIEAASSTWQGEHRQAMLSLEELYLSYDSTYIDVFLGKKIHRWGTGDGINPMDLINPLDTTDPIATGRADNRLATWLAVVSLSAMDMNLELVGIPYAGVQQVPVYGSPWVPSALYQLQDLEEQGLMTLDTTQPTWGNSSEGNSWGQGLPMEFGGRLSWQSFGWDVSLMFFQGVADSPIYTLYPDAMPHAQGQYYTFSAYGLSFAKGFGSQTLRGEFSYKPYYPIQGTQGLERAHLWQGVMGWDWDIAGKYYINVQAFFDAQDRADTSGENVWHGFAYEVSALWLHDALKTGVRGKVYTSGDGSLTEVFAEYTFNDQWKCSAGFLLWTGDSTTLLGQYHENDAAYLTVRYSF